MLEGENIEDGQVDDLGGDVSEPDSSPGDENQNLPIEQTADDRGEPEPRQDPGAQRREGRSGGRSDPGENRIPLARVRQMLARERAETEQRLFRQLEPHLERLKTLQDPEALQRGLAEKFVQTLYPGAQLSKKDPPKYVTESQMQELLGQRDAQYRAEVARTTAISQAQRELDAGRTKYQDVFEAYPDMEQDLIAAWGSRRDKTMSQLVEEKVTRFKAVLDKAAGRYVEDKRKDGEIRPLAPGGRPVPRNTRTHDLSTEDGAEKAALEFLAKGGGVRG